MLNQDTNTLIMIDLETLDLAPNAVVTQFAAIAVSIDDPKPNCAESTSICRFSRSCRSTAPCRSRRFSGG